MTHSAELALQPTVRPLNIIRITTEIDLPLKEFQSLTRSTRMVQLQMSPLQNRLAITDKSEHLTRLDIYIKFSATGAHPKEPLNKASGKLIPPELSHIDHRASSYQGTN